MPADTPRSSRSLIGPHHHVVESFSRELRPILPPYPPLNSRAAASSSQLHAKPTVSGPTSPRPPPPPSHTQVRKHAGPTSAALGNIPVEAGNVFVETGNVHVAAGNVFVETGNVAVEAGIASVETAFLSAARGTAREQAGYATMLNPQRIARWQSVAHPAGAAMAKDKDRGHGRDAARVVQRPLTAPRRGTCRGSRPRRIPWRV